MAAIISDKIKRKFLTHVFDEATGTRIGDSDNYYYVAIGRSQQWNPAGSLDAVVNPVNDEREERNFRYNAQSAKAVEAFSFVVPVDEWTANTQYSAYNDDVVGHPATTYYVKTLDNNVYVCIRTGKDSLGTVQVSTVKPDHTDTTLPIEADGYVWKYLYTISVADVNSFVTSNFMPVKKMIDSAGAADAYFGQYTVQNAAVPGQIIGYRVENGGQSYDSSDTLTVVGDGTGAKARLIVSSGVITAVEVGDSALVGTSGYPTIVDQMGSGYNFANVRITTSTGNDSAEIVPIFAHKDGLGADAREDLRATAMMFNIKLEGDVDGKFVTGNQDYRQVGLWRNPTDSAGVKFQGTSGTILRKITVTDPIPDGYNFASDIKVTGDSNAEAWIDFIEDSTIWYHQTEYTGFTPFRVGEVISIGGGAFTRTVDLHHIEPDIDRFSGDVLFISNDIAQPRTGASADDIKLVIQL